MHYTTSHTLPAPMYFTFPGIRSNLFDIATSERKRDMIVGAVCDYFGVDKEYIKIDKRTRDRVEPRMICMYLLRKHTNMSLKAIGDYFRGKDHTTVLHACNTVRDLMQTEPKFKRSVQLIEERL